MSPQHSIRRSDPAIDTVVRPIAVLDGVRYSLELIMFDNFHAVDRWTKKEAHCIYQAQIVAISTRHADAIDYKFVVDGRSVWVALPLPAWVDYKHRTGQIITDQLGVEIAGHFLKTALESGEGVTKEIYSLTVAETLRHLTEVVQELEANIVVPR